MSFWSKNKLSLMALVADFVTGVFSILLAHDPKDK